MLSHGVWEGVPDLDAPTQLLNPKAQTDFYVGKIPKGVYFPFCGMNYAFRREALPYIYHAPVADFKGAERFDDIWAGFPIVEDFAKLNWGIVSGYSKVYHTRASNVWKNLEKEYIGLERNEHYWKGEYDEWYLSFLDKREQWKKLLKGE
jgi:reversibly glycosylated polypeptide/UDP-arabinopyranose mutase